jgi:hypothetical protein
MGKKKTEYNVEELRECIQAALDNWDFDACDNWPAEQKEALEAAHVDPEHMLNEDGRYEISSYRDIWDALSQYAESTAANISDARERS